MDERTPNRAALLAAATVAGSVGLAAGGSASPLLAAAMTGGAAAAGLPLGVVVSGSALSALVISRRSDRAGRASSLGAGYAFGAFGALLVVAGAGAGSFALVLAGSFLLGAANAALFLTRYAAADVAEPHVRGRAVGRVLLATTAGAVIGPNLLAPSARVARALHLPGLTGLYLLAAPAFAAAAIALARAAHGEGDARAPDAAVSSRAPLARAPRSSPSVRTAFAVLAAANLVMVAIMAITPVHVLEHGHGLGFVGLLVSIHIAAMFAPSPLSGRLADRTSALAVCSLGLCILLAAGVAGALASLTSDAALVGYLIAVGVGWNAAVVAGSSLLIASAPRRRRAQSEGIGEVAMGIAAAAGAPGAGLVVALGGFRALGLGSVLAATAGLGATALAARSTAGAPDRSNAEWKGT